MVLRDADSVSVHAKKYGGTDRKSYLVVGGTSVMGQSVIEAIHEYHAGQGTPFHIYATTSQTEEIQNVDQSIASIDLTKIDACQSIEDGLGSGTKIDFMFYTPARGSVGFPIEAAKEHEIQESIDFSLKPLLQLESRLQPKHSVGISGFMWFESLLKIYGAMFYPKIVMELFAQRHPEKFQVLRIGFFASQSSRAIILMTRKSIAKGLSPQVYSPWVQAATAQKKKIQDFILELHHSCEKEEFGKRFDPASYRKTTTEDMKNGVKKFLATNTKPIINILGGCYWEEEQAYPDWPPAMCAKAEVIYKTLLK